MPTRSIIYKSRPYRTLIVGLAVIIAGLFGAGAPMMAQLPLMTRDFKLQIATGETITLSAPASTLGYSLTLPTTRGLSGSLLSADGNGVLVWTSPNAAVWTLLGNSGTSAATNFLGTTDAQPLVIRTNNIERLRVTNDGLFLIGSSTGTNTLDLTGTFGVTGLITGIGGAVLSGSTSINTTGTASTTIGNTTSATAVTINTSTDGGLTLGGIPTGSASDDVLLLTSSNKVTKTTRANLVAGSGWALAGNSGTTESAALGAAATNTFLGTTDPKSLSLVTNNTVRIQISSAGVVSTQRDMVVNGVNIGRGTAGIESNTVVGRTALAAVTSGTLNTAIGNNALNKVTTGYYNTAIGSNAGESLTTAISNTAIGAESMQAAGTNSTLYNVAVGVSTLKNIGTTGGAEGNVAVGWTALSKLTEGSYNVAIGHSALGDNQNITSSTSSIFIGYNTDANGNAQTNQIVIGDRATGLGSNSVLLGNSSIVQTRLQGRVGIGANPTVNSGDAQLQVTSAAA
ncbi:MAG: hypothetical protein FGM32_11030, partial [Candidatus Kapabacteria bacterium]|nr:hypothetical protein [Candidatus Kapabacteria bacterium]